MDLRAPVNCKRLQSAITGREVTATPYAQSADHLAENGFLLPIVTSRTGCQRPESGAQFHGNVKLWESSKVGHTQDCRTSVDR